MTLPDDRTLASTKTEHLTDHNTLHEFYDDHPTDPGAHSGTYVAIGSGAYAPPLKNTFAMLGDSITNNSGDPAASGGTTLYHGRDWFNWANVLLRKSLVNVGIFGVAGDTTAMILARVGSVTAVSPGWCIVMGGVNDIQNDIAWTTTRDNLIAIYTALRNAGIRVVAGTVTPSTGISTTARKQALSQINAWMLDYARQTPGMIAVNWSAPLADATTGDPATGVTMDGTHQTAVMASHMGRRLADALAPHITTADRLPLSNADPYNVITNGMLTGGTTVATNWVTFGGTVVASKVARRDEIPGEWQQITLQTGSNTLAFQASSGWSIGDTVFGVCEFQTDNDWASVTQFWLEVLAVTNGAGVYDLFPIGTGPDAAFRRPEAGILRTPTLVIPSGTTRLDFKIHFVGGSGTYRISRAALRKVVA